MQDSEGSWGEGVGENGQAECTKDGGGAGGGRGMEGVEKGRERGRESGDVFELKMFDDERKDG